MTKDITVTIPRYLADQFTGQWDPSGTGPSAMVASLVREAIPRPVTITLDYEDARQFQQWLRNDVVWSNYACDDVLDRVDTAFEDAVYENSPSSLR